MKWGERSHEEEKGGGKKKIKPEDSIVGNWHLAISLSGNIFGMSRKGGDCHGGEKVCCPEGHMDRVVSRKGEKGEGVCGIYRLMIMCVVCSCDSTGNNVRRVETGRVEEA